MIGDYPISWLATEIISMILFFMCLVHALNSKDYKHRVLELCCFVLASGIFETVGVLGVQRYSYDQHRILMFGIIPLSTLMIESSILYSGTRLFEHLKVPKWMAIWIVGFWCALVDFSIDPVFVNDTYLYDNVLSGQWNWVHSYDFTYCGIPFFNFSGWIFMTGIYAWLTQKFKVKCEEKKHPILENFYQIIIALLLLIPIALFVPLISTMFNATKEVKNIYELIVLLFNCIFAIILFATHWKKLDNINFKKDWIIFAIPLIIDIFDLILAFALHITISYIPVIVVFVIHILFFAILYNKKRLPN